MKKFILTSALALTVLFTESQVKAFKCDYGTCPAKIYLNGSGPSTDTGDNTLSMWAFSFTGDSEALNFTGVTLAPNRGYFLCNYVDANGNAMQVKLNPGGISPGNLCTLGGNKNSCTSSDPNNCRIICDWPADWQGQVQCSKPVS